MNVSKDRNENTDKRLMFLIKVILGIFVLNWIWKDWVMLNYWWFWVAVAAGAISVTIIESCLGPKRRSNIVWQVSFFAVIFVALLSIGSTSPFQKRIGGFIICVVVLSKLIRRFFDRKSRAKPT